MPKDEIAYIVPEGSDEHKKLFDELQLSAKDEIKEKRERKKKNAKSE